MPNKIFSPNNFILPQKIITGLVTWVAIASQKKPTSNNKDAQLEKIVLEKASGVITTIGGDFHKNLLRKNPQQKVISIPNGYDEELILKIPIITSLSNILKSLHMMF